MDGITPGRDTIDLAIGAPRHAFPDFIRPILDAAAAGYGRYPPIEGTEAFRASAAAWLARRYHLAAECVNPDTQILPVNGTREGLFSVAFAVKEATDKPLALVPDPAYQCYAAAAEAAGFEVHFMPVAHETGFLPDFAALPQEILARVGIAYLCSPANPQGVVASHAYLTALVALSRRHGFTLVMDECYADIYTSTPPVGILEVAPDMAGVVAFHSLSKRSNVPGLRSGFCVGEAALIGRFRAFRTLVGPQTPFPVQAAAAALWADDAHALENRRLYARKYKVAEEVLGVARPAGGFFLWLEVGDGEAAAVRLWEEEGVRVLPGAYLCASEAAAREAHSYIRVALVEVDDNRLKDALTRISKVLGKACGEGADSLW